MTYRHVVYDIHKTLKKNFDDADITLNQVLYWVMVVANKIRVQHNEIVNADMFTSTFAPVVINIDNKGRKYIDLPAPVMSLSNNSGIVYISYNVETNCCAGPAFAQTFFEPVNVSEVQHLYLDKYTTPSAKSPYFYRVGDKVDGVDVSRLYLLGLECVAATDLEVALKASLDPKKLCSLDDELSVPDELIQVLTTEVLQLGRFVMMMPEERQNSGEDEAEINTSGRGIRVPTPQSNINNTEA